MIMIPPSSHYKNDHFFRSPLPEFTKRLFPFIDYAIGISIPTNFLKKITFNFKEFHTEKIFDSCTAFFFTDKKTKNDDASVSEALSDNTIKNYKNYVEECMPNFDKAKSIILHKTAGLARVTKKFWWPIHATIIMLLLVQGQTSYILTRSSAFSAPGGKYGHNTPGILSLSMSYAATNQSGQVNCNGSVYVQDVYGQSWSVFSACVSTSLTGVAALLRSVLSTSGENRQSSLCISQPADLDGANALVNGYAVFSPDFSLSESRIVDPYGLHIKQLDPNLLFMDDDGLALALQYSGTYTLDGNYLCFNYPSTGPEPDLTNCKREIPWPHHHHMTRSFGYTPYLDVARKNGENVKVASSRHTRGKYLYSLTGIHTIKINKIDVYKNNEWLGRLHHFKEKNQKQFLRGGSYYPPSNRIKSNARIFDINQVKREYPCATGANVHYNADFYRVPMGRFTSSHATWGSRPVDTIAGNININL